VPTRSLIRPDVLVLGAGGTLGEAWMTGLLAGIEAAAAIDLRETESFVGTSAGAIVAARLAAGRRPRPPAGRGRIVAAAAPPPRGPGRAERLAIGILSPASSLALRLEPVPGGLARRGALALMAAGTRSDGHIQSAVARLRASFDGRLRVVCVERRSGRRVVFGAPGAPAATVAQAVAASCAIPGYFRPVRIAGRDYVDGAAWSLTNLDAAPAGRRTELLCLNPMRGLPVATISRLGLVNRVVRGREALEVAVVRGRGARVRVIGPAAEAGRLMAPSLMDPGPREAVLHAGYAQGLALGRAA
jgi:NTE family protein